MNCKKGFQSFYGWLALIPNPIIQTNEAWFLTNTEKVHALFTKIYEVIDTVNSYNELMKELNGILNEFDNTVKGEVTKYIKKLYDDGELANIVGRIVAESVVPTQSNLDPKHIARVLHYAHYWEADGYGDSSYDVERYSYPQGNCAFVGEDGNTYWAVAYVCQNGSHFTYNDKAMIYLYRINNKTTEDYETDEPMTFMSKTLVSAVGHCNGMCYHKGYLYITPNSYSGSVDTTVPAGLTCDVIRFRVNFDYRQILPTGERKTPAVFPLSNNWTDCICSTGEELYFTDGYLNIYKYNFDTNDATCVHRQIGGKYLSRPQNGMCISNDYIYVLATDQRLLRYNRAIETIDMCYVIPEKCNDHMFKTGEIEGISLIGDDIYFGAGYNLGGNLYTNGVAVTRFLKQNIKTNGYSASYPYVSGKTLNHQVINWTSGVTNNVSLYVGGEIPKDDDNPRNPFGLRDTDEDTFSCVQECLDYIEGNDWIKRANIVVNQRLNQIPIDIKTIKPIQISGSSYLKKNNDRPIVGHISATGTNIMITDLCVRCYYANDLLPKLDEVTGSNNCIYLYRCQAVVNGLYCPVGTQHPDVTVMIYAIGSIVNFVNPITTQVQWQSTRGTYIQASNGTVNAHGNVALTQATQISDITYDPNHIFIN